MNTILSDGKNTIEIDTCIISGVGALIDRFFEKDTTGELETMINLNGVWLNFTQERHKNTEEAIKYHKKLVDLFKKSKSAEIILKCEGNQVNESRMGIKGFMNDKYKVKDLIKR